MSIVTAAASTIPSAVAAVVLLLLLMLLMVVGVTSWLRVIRVMVVLMADVMIVVVMHGRWTRHIVASVWQMGLVLHPDLVTVVVWKMSLRCLHHSGLYVRYKLRHFISLGALIHLIKVFFVFIFFFFHLLLVFTIYLI